MNITTLLDDYSPLDPTEAGHLAAMRRLASAGSAALARSTFQPGHFTASALVLSPDQRQLALLWHPRLLRWLQPGGHLEPDDASPLAATLREVQEEIGLQDLDLFDQGLFDIDVHDIPANKREPAHQHFDLRYAFTARSWTLQGEHEARWVDLDQVSAVESDASVMRAVGKLRRRLG